MSKRELTRLEVMQRLKDKRLTQKEAANAWIEHSTSETALASLPRKRCSRIGKRQAW
jgi:hypothetical protein